MTECLHTWKTSVQHPKSRSDYPKDSFSPSKSSDTLYIRESCQSCGTERWASYRRQGAPDTFVLVDQDTALERLKRKNEHRERGGHYSGLQTAASTAPNREPSHTEVDRTVSDHLELVHQEDQWNTKMSEYYGYDPRYV